MSHRILIVDDDISSRILLRRVLELGGFEVVEAANGGEALAEAGRRPPDLILLDVEMPGVDGLEVCRRLRLAEETRRIPVIFLSARTGTTDKVAGLELGARDYIGKPFSREEVLARVRTQIEILTLNRGLMAANRELEDRQLAMDEDLAAAAVIQRSLLPAKGLRVGRCRVDYRFQPCDFVGGDLITVHELDDRHLGAAIVDVSGHGVGSAMVSVAVSQLLLPQRGLTVSSTKEVVRPVEVVEALDRELPFSRFKRFITGVYMVIDHTSGVMQIANAAHPKPLLLHASGSIERIEGGGSIVGFGGPVPFVQTQVELVAGDRLFLFTDGLTEHEDADGEQFGPERLAEVVVRHVGADLDEHCALVLRDVRDFAGDRTPEDDMALLAVSFD